MAEVYNQYLKKGSKVFVEGRIKFDQWQDKNGMNKSKHSIVVERLVLCLIPNNKATKPTKSSYAKTTCQRTTTYYSTSGR